MWANWVVESNPFQNFMLVLILVNAVLLVVDAEIGESTDPQLIVSINYIKTLYLLLYRLLNSQATHKPGFL